jgi:hypothetical protein
MTRAPHLASLVTVAATAVVAAVAAVAVLAAAGCGGKASPPATIGSHAGGGVARGPAMVFVGIADDTMFEAACHDCDALRERLDGQVVSSGPATFRISGTVSDDCDASGPSDVIGVRRLTGDPEAAPLAVAVLPAGAPIDLVSYDTSKVDVSDGQLRPVLLRRAQADVPALADDLRLEDLVIEQVIEVNVAGDSKPELLVAANVPELDDNGPGYRWSALVMAPGGDLEHLVTLWQSTLEHLVIDASFDLDGDGLHDVVYSAEYYEGGGRGAATITNGTLDLLGTWGCGA